MKWTLEAEAAVKKVPFFVRKKVRSRIENEAETAGKKAVSLADVKATQARFLSNMSSEIKGYQLDTCFGTSGCPNRANSGDKLLERIERLLKEEDLLGFLKQQVKGELKFHHEFRITIADCPNACSQPQIKDIGIIGASLPVLTDETCTLCEACVDECRENAISLQKEKSRPDINYDLCLACGKCIEGCPTGTIETDKRGFRVQLGGKLGRHPQLAKELPDIYSEDEVIGIIKSCIAFYKENSKHGERFAEIFKTSDYNNFIP
ncbi:MAG: 4Fe-4S binding protein [Deltaproteobacteria bacterium]|nr:4Fe-4S binding protein [Deltaproteobacteria bacterium]